MTCVADWCCTALCSTGRTCRTPRCPTTSCPPCQYSTELYPTVHVYTAMVCTLAVVCRYSQGGGAMLEGMMSYGQLSALQAGAGGGPGLLGGPGGGPPQPDSLARISSMTNSISPPQTSAGSLSPGSVHQVYLYVCGLCMPAEFHPSDQRSAG